MRTPSIKSYFEITEDPPQPLPVLRTTLRSLKPLPLPTSAYFFIDFTERKHCHTQSASCG